MLRHRSVTSALVEVDTPIDDDVALVVVHDVVALQAVTVLIEVVGACRKFGTGLQKDLLGLAFTLCPRRGAEADGVDGSRSN